jgi:hypothetical protein
VRIEAADPGSAEAVWCLERYFEELDSTGRRGTVPPFNDEYYAHHWFEKSLPKRERGTT